MFSMHRSCRRLHASQHVHPDEIEDAVQDTLSSVAVAGKDRTGPASPGNDTTCIATNTALQCCTCAQRKPCQSLDLPHATGERE